MSINHYLTNVDLNARIREKCDITVATLAERDALLTWRRKWSMIVGVYNDADPDNNKYYSLKYNQNSTDLADNDNWVILETDPIFTAWLNKWDNINSAARLWGGLITSNGNGTVAIAAGGGLIKADDAGPETVPTAIDEGQGSELTEINWEAVSSLELVDDAYNFVYYEGSTGTIKTTVDFYSISFTRDFTLGRGYRSGNSVIIRLCGTNAWNYNRRVQLFGEERFPVERAKGLMIGGSGRYITISSGIVWAELVNRFTVFPAATFPLGGFDSEEPTQTFSYWYRSAVAGQWTRIDGESIISNTQYDDDSGTLANLLPNRYGVHWVYVVHDSTVHVVYGQGNYTQAEAQAAAAPATIPGLLSSYATFVGKITIQRSGTTFFEVLSPFVDRITSGTVNNHNDLSGKQGGEADQYYHLNLERFQQIVNAKPAGHVFAGPTAGVDAEPLFRSLIITDIPDLSSLYLIAETDPVAMAAIGNREYTEKNYIADGETITASLDKLDQAVKDNELTYVSQLGALIWK